MMQVNKEERKDTLRASMASSRMKPMPSRVRTASSGGGGTGRGRGDTAVAISMVIILAAIYDHTSGTRGLHNDRVSMSHVG